MTFRSPPPPRNKTLLRRRSGFAMVCVLVATTALSAWTAGACREIGASLRLRRVRKLQQLVDTGSLEAAGHTLRLLETGFPATNPTIGSVVINNANGARTYTVTISFNNADRYTVSVAPTAAGQSVSPLPSIFTATKDPK